MYSTDINAHRKFYRNKAYLSSFLTFRLPFLHFFLQESFVDGYCRLHLYGGLSAYLIIVAFSSEWGNCPVADARRLYALTTASWFHVCHAFIHGRPQKKFHGQFHLILTPPFYSISADCLTVCQVPLLAPACGYGARCTRDKLRLVWDSRANC